MTDKNPKKRVETPAIKSLKEARKLAELLRHFAQLHGHQELAKSNDLIYALKLEFQSDKRVGRIFLMNALSDTGIVVLTMCMSVFVITTVHKCYSIWFLSRLHYRIYLKLNLCDSYLYLVTCLVLVETSSQDSLKIVEEALKSFNSACI